ncbi:MAG: cellulase family glycosylhydrolase [Thermoguttaceae bacterium]
MKKYRLSLVVLCCFASFFPALTSAKELLPGQWSAEKVAAWYDAQPWIVGCNFLPSTAINDVEMWQSTTFDPQTIDRELGWASEWGLNSVRVFLNYVVWEAEPEALKKNFTKFLELAERHKITVMPILFDDCNFSGNVAKVGPQQDPVPGIHNSGWVSSPPVAMLADKSQHPKLKAYLQDIVGTFANDKRIIIWDLYNEPGNGPGDSHFDFVRNTFVWAREMKPSQPLTIGAWAGFSGNKMSEMFRDDSDVVSYHGYGNKDSVETCITWCEDTGRPVVCTEWLLRQGGNTPQTLLSLFKEKRVGIYNWGLVEGRTQTYFHWGSQPGTPKPRVWQHDLIRNDGKPYNNNEYHLFRKMTLGIELPPEAVRKVVPLLPTSAKVPQAWKYTETKPADNWMTPNFNDSAWKDGNAPFGASDPLFERHPSTNWTLPNIWLRRTFEVSEDELKNGQALELIAHFDENAVVFLNGVEIIKLDGFNAAYETIELDPVAIKSLKVGKNVLAVQCENIAGGQYVDVGVELLRKQEGFLFMEAK